MARRDPARELRSSEERFRKIFDHSNDGIFLIDPVEDRILDVNDRACRMLGYERQELLDASMSLVHPHEIGPMTRFAEGVFERGAGWTDELSCRTKSGRFVAAEISASIMEMAGRTCMIALVRDVSERERLARENAYLQDELRAELGQGAMVGDSPALGKVREQIAMVAQTDATVLISGESGTGKELVAQAIHDASRRRDAPFIRVNCASIPAELFESEFFGHVKGSFTGAVSSRTGRFELADGGTLLLDEVGEIPLELQGKLLRVLQEGQFERIGESRTRQVDVRILAATNRDLIAASQAGRFREDLYYRLSVFPITLPPLRARREDIGALAERFAAQSCARHGHPPLRPSDADLRLLQRHDWPGNVRELENAVDRAVIVGGGKRLDFAHLSPPRIARVDVSELARKLQLDDLKRLEREIVARAIQDAGGRVYGENGAAARLGLPPTTLASRLKRLGL